MLAIIEPSEPTVSPKSATDPPPLFVNTQPLNVPHPEGEIEKN